MGLLILLGLLALPLAEIAGFVAVGGEIGVLATLGLVLLGFFAGLAVLRLQGLTTALEVRRALARDEVPARALFDGACRVTAGLLLMLPGFVSDAIAILLLLPPLRGLLFGMIARRVAAHGTVELHMRTTGRPPRGRSPVIEGEFEEVDPDDPDDRPGQPPRLAGDGSPDDPGRDREDRQ